MDWSLYSLVLRFTWPGMGKDVLEYVQSCDACLRLNKTSNRQVHMVE